MSSAEYDEYAGIADLYDHVALYRERADIQFYVDAARDSGGPVLEIGCGTGRILIPTARAGIEITGLDLSRHMQGVCRERLESEPPEVRSRVHLVAADMRDFAIPRQFHLATIPFRPFQHLMTVDDQLACLKCIRRHLTDEGILVFDVFNPSLEALVNGPRGAEIEELGVFETPDGRRISRRFKTISEDRFEQRLQIELIYYIQHPDGREERQVQAFAFRYLFRFEVEHLLRRAGFTVEKLYGDFDKSPFGSKYPGELIFVARRTSV